MDQNTGQEICNATPSKSTPKSFTSVDALNKADSLISQEPSGLLSDFLRTSNLKGKSTNFAEGPLQQILKTEMNILKLELQQFVNEIHVEALRRKYRMPVPQEKPEDTVNQPKAAAKTKSKVFKIN